MEHADHRGEVLVAERERDPDEVVRVDQVERFRVDVEHREDTGLEAHLPPCSGDSVPVEGEALAEAHRRDVGELAIVEVALPGGREMRPARIGDQRLEEHAAREHAGLPLGQNARRLGGGARRRGRRLDTRLEHHDARHAADPFELRDDAGPVGGGEIRRRERDDAVVHAQRRCGQRELALEDGRGVAGDERVVGGRGQGARDRQDSQKEDETRGADHHHDPP